MIIVKMQEVRRDIETALKHVQIDPIELAVEAIEVDISDRKDLKRIWSSIDEDIRLQIKAKWKAIIRECTKDYIKTKANDV